MCLKCRTILSLCQWFWTEQKKILLLTDQLLRDPGVILGFNGSGSTTRFFKCEISRIEFSPQRFVRENTEVMYSFEYMHNCKKHGLPKSPKEIMFGI